MTTPTNTADRHPPGRSNPGSATREIWTAERIRGLGAVTDIKTAASIFGLSRTVAYELAHRDQFPVPLIRVGSRYRVPVAAILTALHLPTQDPPPAAT